jgi:hypothetical protein
MRSVPGSNTQHITIGAGMLVVFLAAGLRIWVHPTGALRRIFTHMTPMARRASDHLPVVADLDQG